MKGTYVCEIRDQDGRPQHIVGIYFDHESKSATIYDGSEDLNFELKLDGSEEFSVNLLKGSLNNVAVMLVNSYALEWLDILNRTT